MNTEVSENIIEVVPPQASIKMLKLISVDNGVSWIDAYHPPGPYIVKGTNPKFKFIVTNDGEVPITEIEVNDNKYGLIGSAAVLNPDESLQWIIEGVWSLGPHVNEAEAKGKYVERTVVDNYRAHYRGIDICISIVKYVSVNNGMTWLDADTSPGPLLPEGISPKFKYVIKNCGEETLSDIVLEDSVLGVLPTPITLGKNQVYELIV